MSQSPPRFDSAFRAQLRDLLSWRRDVRRFKPDPIPKDLLTELLATACLAPSVGNSQPWRFVVVETPTLRAAVIRDYESCNAEALRAYTGELAAKYATLKLAGLKEAPVHLAVFADHATLAGHGLGSRTMPETLEYSVVSAIQVLWLAARAHQIGLGWVSILNPEAVNTLLDVPESWRFIGYLCLGYPVEEHEDPELVRHGLQDRIRLDEVVFKR